MLTWSCGTRSFRRHCRREPEAELVADLSAPYTPADADRVRTCVVPSPQRLVASSGRALTANDLRPRLLVDRFAGGASSALEVLAFGFTERVRWVTSTCTSARFDRDDRPNSTSSPIACSTAAGRRRAAPSRDGRGRSDHAWPPSGCARSPRT